MPPLAAFADEVAALARDARRIRLGDRSPERPYEQVDSLAHGLERLAARMRAGVPANDAGPAEPAKVRSSTLFYRGRPVVTIYERRP